MQVLTGRRALARARAYTISHKLDLIRIALGLARARAGPAARPQQQQQQVEGSAGGKKGRIDPVEGLFQTGVSPLLRAES